MRINPNPTVMAMQPDEAPELRAFCLETIGEAFGYSYRTDWHADLDELLAEVHAYHPDRRGAFLVARSEGDEGEIVGCGGLRAITSHPVVAERFAGRYPDLDRVGSIWRVYISPRHQSQGLGARITAELEHHALGHGYDRLYLHTSARTPRAVAFWRRQGYEPFIHDAGSADDTVHMDKVLGGPRVEALSGRTGLRALLQPAR